MKVYKPGEILNEVKLLVARGPIDGDVVYINSILALQISALASTYPGDYIDSTTHMFSYDRLVRLVPVIEKAIAIQVARKLE